MSATLTADIFSIKSARYDVSNISSSSKTWHTVGFYKASFKNSKSDEISISILCWKYDGGVKLRMDPVTTKLEKKVLRLQILVRYLHAAPRATPQVVAAISSPPVNVCPFQFQVNTIYQRLLDMQHHPGTLANIRLTEHRSSDSDTNPGVYSWICNSSRVKPPLTNVNSISHDVHSSFLR
jgi:hypothetical protein